MRSISKSEAVRNLIIEDIHAGWYASGDVLPSIETLAKRFEVSKNTVSLALSGLREAGIVRLEHGKATRVTGQLFKRHVEVIVYGQYPALHDPFWGEFTRVIGDELREHADVTFRQTSLVESFLWTWEEIPEHIRRGCLLLLGTASEEVVRRIRQSRIPFALVFDANPAGKYPFFSVDLEPAIDEIVARFARAGCSRVAYIGTEGDHNMGRENINRSKHRLFNAALERHGLPVLPELHSDCLHFMRCGYRAIRELLEKHRAPDAVFFASDVLAPGGYKALHEAGLRVPEDVVAAGCDNLEIGDYVVPPLTTIEFDRYGIGRAAASGLVARLHGRESIPSRFFPAAIVNRESFPIQHS